MGVAAGEKHPKLPNLVHGGDEGSCQGLSELHLVGQARVIHPDIKDLGVAQSFLKRRIEAKWRSQQVVFVHLPQMGRGEMSYILNCIRTGAPGVLGSEGVGEDLAFPRVEVHLHRPTLAGHNLSLLAPEDGLVTVVQVLHQLAEDVCESSFILSVREEVPRAIGQQGSYLQFFF